MATVLGLELAVWAIPALAAKEGVAEAEREPSRLALSKSATNRPVSSPYRPQKADWSIAGGHWLWDVAGLA
jgi:hypothetical protein